MCNWWVKNEHTHAHKQHTHFDQSRDWKVLKFLQEIYIFKPSHPPSKSWSLQKTIFQKGFQAAYWRISMCLLIFNQVSTVPYTYCTYVLNVDKKPSSQFTGFFRKNKWKGLLYTLWLICIFVPFLSGRKITTHPYPFPYKMNSFPCSSIFSKASLTLTLPSFKNHYVQ